MNVSAASAAERLLRSAVERHVFPGAVAEAGSSDAVLWRASFGRLTYDERATATEANTLFDLASLTKPIATTSVVLKLEGENLLPLDTHLSATVPEWTGADRERVTVRHLLEHASGLSARLLDRPPHHRRAFEHDICSMPLEYAPGTRSIYSDLGFILLGFCCEHRGQASLATQARSLLDVIPPAENAEILVAVPSDARERTAPTSPLPEDDRRGRRLAGEVHDNYAAALGGFAGHAGLFGTAGGVGQFARMILAAARGESAGPEPFTPERVQRSMIRSTVPGSSRALGWDTMMPTSSCGTRLSSAAFGHVGFTGTSLWIDPALDRYFVLLSNRVLDGGTSEDMQQVRRAFHDALASL
jgi:CubicO group peptidase (beta-lactamase class C family)